ncbi:hypothetical protein [Levilactobacillus wangkuiensis]|uniref:hypothetical protein n=1 Tax=Levilactobacillus wangkuiensis TaxID=2799566 RepID=UPI0019425632|nr:hypothetical protein [Levilactobacillus wangkuiensis]
MKISYLKEFLEKEGYEILDGVGILLIREIGKNGDGSFISKTKVGEYFVSGLPRRISKEMAELAWTPIEKRNDEKRWIVVIACDTENGEKFYTVWSKGYTLKSYHTRDDVAENLLHNPYYVFTDSEFDGLISYLKSLPHGDVYARIAVLGKREAKQ